MVLSADFITNRDQMCVYATESVGWIFIIAICGDLFTPLARVSKSWPCKWAVLLHSSDTELPKSHWSVGWGHPTDETLGHSPLCPPSKLRPSNLWISSTGHPYLGSSVLTLIPPQRKTSINVGLLWYGTATTKPMGFLSPSCRTPSELMSTGCLCWH